MQAKTLLKESNILKNAMNTLDLESQSIANLKDKLNSDFVSVVNAIYSSTGRVVITGIGKSAIIGQKMVATFNSTGTPALFMHAADAIHGDLGMIQKGDIVIIISKSGTSPEIKALIPLIKTSNSIVAITGNLNSILAQEAEYVLDTTVDKEACPNNLAPTTSTVAQMAMGDALAVSLLHARDFSEKDFAKYHPGGALGKRIYLRIDDLSTLNEKPTVSPDASLKEVIIKISEGRIGAVIVVEANEVRGIITDGDLRRMLHSSKPLEGIIAEDIMTADPMTIDSSSLAMEGVEMIKKNKINHVISVKNNELEGVVHIQDFIREGLL